MPVAEDTDAILDYDALDQRGQDIYESRLKPVLEPEHNGEAVAIHVDTGRYVTDSNWAMATRRLRRELPDGYIYTLFIGPPTPAENSLALRFGATKK